MLGIEDIARELTVSPSLVSKVLNGRLGMPRMSAKTPAAIREHADMIGIFIHRVGVAIGAINVTIGYGIRMPQDMKVIGVDNSPFCPFNVVPLSSVNQEETQRGRLAVRLLNGCHCRPLSTDSPRNPADPTRHSVEEVTTCSLRLLLFPMRAWISNV